MLRFMLLALASLVLASLPPPQDIFSLGEISYNQPIAVATVLMVALTITTVVIGYATAFHTYATPLPAGASGPKEVRAFGRSFLRPPLPVT